MRIAIDIPVMTLLNITSRGLLLCSREDIEKLEFAIKNGTFLPDIEDAKKDMNEYEED